MLTGQVGLTGITCPLQQGRLKGKALTTQAGSSIGGSSCCVGASPPLLGPRRHTWCSSENSNATQCAADSKGSCLHMCQPFARDAQQLRMAASMAVHCFFRLSALRTGAPHHQQQMSRVEHKRRRTLAVFLLQQGHLNMRLWPWWPMASLFASIQHWQQHSAATAALHLEKSLPFMPKLCRQVFHLCMGAALPKSCTTRQASSRS